MEFTAKHQTFIVNSHLRTVRFIRGVNHYNVCVCVDGFLLAYSQLQQNFSTKHYVKASQVSEMQYRIIKATMEDRDKILDFLRQNFYNEEPINAAMNNESNTLSKADEEHTLALLQEEISFLAVSNDEELIGICLSGLVTSKEAEDMEGLAETCGCERFSKLLYFLSFVERQSNIWGKSGTSSGLSVQALAVTQAARGHGVGRALLEKTRELAKNEGYSLFRVDCSSYFSARLAEDIGMECIFSLPFSEYKDKDGCPIFKVKTPNHNMKIYIQKLT